MTVVWLWHCSGQYFGSLDHKWLLRFVEHRVGDPRILSLIRRRLRAGIIEDGVVTESMEGTAQGESISVLLSNIYLHFVLDLWFERVVRPRMQGECYLVRYLDDFVVCFQLRTDAIRFQNVLSRRLARFGLELEPDKTKLLEFGRFTQIHARERGTRPDTLSFLGFTHICTRNRKGNFQVGRKTEKGRFRRSAGKLKELISKVQHWKVKEQVAAINQFLRGHFGYYGLGGNMHALHRILRVAERMWRRSLASRCRKEKSGWDRFNRLRAIFSFQRPKLRIPYQRMKEFTVL